MQGRSQKWPEEGVLGVRKRCGCTSDGNFAQILVKMTKKFGPMGSGFWPPNPPPPLATPLCPTQWRRTGGIPPQLELCTTKCQKSFWLPLAWKDLFRRESHLSSVSWNAKANQEMVRIHIWAWILNYYYQHMGVEYGSIVPCSVSNQGTLLKPFSAGS